jgi:hypothetical protein
MARGRKPGQTFENGYKKVMVIARLAVNELSTADYWRLRRVTNKAEVASQIVDGTTELHFEVRESRGARLAAALRSLSIGGEKVQATFARTD